MGAIKHESIKTGAIKHGCQHYMPTKPETGKESLTSKAQTNGMCLEGLQYSYAVSACAFYAYGNQFNGKSWYSCNASKCKIMSLVTWWSQDHDLHWFRP